MRNYLDENLPVKCSEKACPFLSYLIGETEGRRIKGFVYRIGKMYVCVCVYVFFIK
jgi:hypothetical protein